MEATMCCCLHGDIHVCYCSRVVCSVAHCKQDILLVSETGRGLLAGLYEGEVGGVYVKQDWELLEELCRNQKPKVTKIN